MHTGRRIWTDPIFLVGLIVSIAIALAMVLLGKDDILSFLVGLAGLTITLLLDLIDRLQKTEDRFLVAAELSHLLMDDELRQSLQDIAGNYCKMEAFSFRPYRDIAKASIAECQTKMRDLAAGSVSVTPGKFGEYGVIGTKDASKSIKGVFAGSMSFWTTDFGKRYLGLDKAARTRGVKITRIFALSAEDQKTHATILEEQRSAGIEVVVIRPGVVDKEYSLFDDRILVENDVVDGRYTREQVTLDPVRVGKRVMEFDFLVKQEAGLRTGTEKPAS
jgi:hypothetical protein